MSPRRQATTRRWQLVIGGLAVLLAVPIAMTSFGGNPVLCDHAAETIAGGGYIEVELPAEHDLSRDQVCVVLPRWFRADGSTTLPITVSGGSDRRLDLTLIAVTGAAFPDGSTRTERMRQDVLLRTAEPSITPTGDGDVRLVVEIAGRNVIYRAEVGGPTLGAISAIWERIRWAFVPTVVWLALYIAAAFIWIRFGAVKELPPDASAHYERPIVDGSDVW